MIPRYSRSAMAAIWSQEATYRIWLDIETCAAEAEAAFGMIPKEAASAIRTKGGYDAARIAEIEKETRHEFLAFLTDLAEHVGGESRFIHQGMTSSDVLDTCLAVQLTRAADLLLEDIDAVLVALLRRAVEHKATPCIARTHGIHAEPTSFGLKLLGHYAAFRRGRERLVLARREIATCKISGAVGTYATLDPAIEEHIAHALGLQVEPHSTQIIPRDRHAMFFATLGVIAGSIENLALEIRHLQRTEVREAQEAFAKGQKGSSAMPHKRNPILSENLTGLSRIVRAAVTPALENIALWHERDMSHSSVERVFAPDATVALDFALHRLTGLIDDLVIDPERMRANLDSTGGLYFSQAVLLALTQAGQSREDAYRIVQQASRRVWDEGGSLHDCLSADPAVQKILPGDRLSALFNTAPYLRHVDAIFARVLESD